MSDLRKPERLADLLKKEPPEEPCYIYPGVLPKKGTLLFGAVAKAGKSMIALELARALATGTPLFGNGVFRIPKAVRVLYVEQELGEYGLYKRVEKIFKNEDPAVYGENLWYISKEPGLKLDTNEGIGNIVRLLDSVQPNVLIFDPAGKMHTLNENDNSDIERLFNNIEKLKRRYDQLDLSVVLSHHFGKPLFVPGNGPQPDPLNPYNMRGASKWYDAPDTMLMVAKTRNLAVEHKAWELRARWVTRHDEGPEEMVLSVNRKNDLRVRYERKGGTLPPLEIRERAEGI